MTNPEGVQVPGSDTLADQPPLSPEQEEQAKEMAKELAETRVRLMETEVSTVVANHCFGLYELAAIHLTAEPPKFDETKLAIDALAALVEGLEGKLGEAEPTLKDGLHQLRMGFVQRNAASTTDTNTSEHTDNNASDEEE